MLALETRIIELLRGLAVSLQLSTLLPALLLMGGLVWLIYPAALTGNGELLAALGIGVVTVSYLFNAFNMVIIRALEGYICANSVPLRFLRLRQLTKFYEHHSRIYHYDQIRRELRQERERLQLERRLTEQHREWFGDWERGWRDRMEHERERLEERYPPTPDRIMATGLGNTIAAFESYSHRRYRMDMASLWTRFVPTLVEKKFASFIEGEKAILDFFMNMLLVSVVLWLIDMPVFAFTGKREAGILFLTLPLFGAVLYKGTCVAAANWGTLIKSAFDLYRFELKRALSLKLPENADLAVERRMWQSISDFLADGRTEHFGGFDYAAVSNKTPKEEAPL